MLKVTEMDAITRKRERIETGVVVDVRQGMVTLERYLPNGKPEVMDLYCTAWDRVKPGESCLDIQRCCTGGSNSAIRIVGFTPSDIAQDFMKSYKTRKAAQ